MINGRTGLSTTLKVFGILALTASGILVLIGFVSYMDAYYVSDEQAALALVGYGFGMLLPGLLLLALVQVMEDIRSNNIFTQGGKIRVVNQTPVQTTTYKQPVQTNQQTTKKVSLNVNKWNCSCGQENLQIAKICRACGKPKQ